MESENVNVVKRLFKIQNLNASTIRTVMVADCSRFDSPDLLLDAGAPPPGRVFDLGSDSEDEAGGPGPGPAPARTKEGLRRFLDGFLDGRAQPQLSEHALETKVAELLAQGRTKPPEHSMADARKLLIFTTGCLTYSPHQIGRGAGPPASLEPGGEASPGLGWGPVAKGRAGVCGQRLLPLFVLGATLVQPPGEHVPGPLWFRRCCPHLASRRHQTDPAAPDDHSRACAGRGPGLGCLL